MQLRRHWVARSTLSRSRFGRIAFMVWARNRRHVQAVANRARSALARQGPCARAMPQGCALYSIKLGLELYERWLLHCCYFRKQVTHHLSNHM
jgi:hypothetical protein